MLNELNETQEVHVVTLEDPIEFLHPHSKAAFSQRELGKDFPDFATGLRAAMRQAPKVILLGEIRDRETMEIALTASETGHLVFSTLHTINAGQSINRILGLFTSDEEKQVRERLADVLRYVVSQRLVSRRSTAAASSSPKSWAAACARARHSFTAKAKTAPSRKSSRRAARSAGTASISPSCALLKRTSSTEETALLFCTHKNKMLRDLEMAKKLRGIQSTTSRRA